MMFCCLFQTQCVPGGSTRFGIENTDALMPDWSALPLVCIGLFFNEVTPPPCTDYLFQGEPQSQLQQACLPPRAAPSAPLVDNALKPRDARQQMRCPQRQGHPPVVSLQRTWAPIWPRAFQCWCRWAATLEPPPPPPHSPPPKDRDRSNSDIPRAGEGCPHRQCTGRRGIGPR